MAALRAPRADRDPRRAPRLPRRPRRGRAALGARRLPQPGPWDQRPPRDDRHHQRVRAGGRRCCSACSPPRGARTLAVEDPSAVGRRPPDRATPSAWTWSACRSATTACAWTPCRDLDADVLILTPSHQWPTGGVLSPEARAAVLAWSQRTGALVLEDDYDAEYRYDRAPIGAIQGLDPERVAYAGTASKTLAPGLRLGWLILPPTARRAVRRGQAARRPRLPHPRPAHLRRLPLAGPVRPSPAAHAPRLPLPPRRPAGRPRAAPSRFATRRDRRRAAPGDVAARRSRRGDGDRGRRPRRSRRRRRLALPALPGAARRSHLRLLEPQRAAHRATASAAWPAPSRASARSRPRQPGQRRSGQPHLAGRRAKLGQRVMGVWSRGRRRLRDARAPDSPAPPGRTLPDGRTRSVA